MNIQFLDAEQVTRALDYPGLAAALRRDFAAGTIEAPVRTGHVMRQDQAGSDTLLMMPAWADDGALGVKLVTVRLSSQRRAGDTVTSVYILFDPLTGAPLACIEGDTLTRRRTAAVSALAASFLARRDADTLLMVGTGSLSTEMVLAHAALRRLRRVAIWGREKAKAESRAKELRALGLDVEAADDLEQAVRQADIVSCATTAREPIVRGEWLQAGKHLDLVGGFRPDMREVDDTAVARAALFADTRAGVLAEAGDIIRPLQSGALDKDSAIVELAELCAGAAPGRHSADQITLFKSVGTSIADLCAARLAWTSRERDPK